MLTLIVVAASLSAPITTITSLNYLRHGLFRTVKQFIQESKSSEIALGTTSIVTAVDIHGFAQYSH